MSQNRASWRIRAQISPDPGCRPNCVRSTCASCRLTSTSLRMSPSSSKTPREIAQLSGYHDQGAFTRAFRATPGLTPLEYRRREQVHERELSEGMRAVISRLGSKAQDWRGDSRNWSRADCWAGSSRPAGASGRNATRPGVNHGSRRTADSWSSVGRGRWWEAPMNVNLGGTNLFQSRSGRSEANRFAGWFLDAGHRVVL